VEQDLFLNFLEVRDINSFLYEIDAHTTLQCAFNGIQILKLNSMQIQLKKNNMQIDGEGIEIFLVNMDF
jgi:hypothetical protein